jgi:hypothetical protein
MPDLLQLVTLDSSGRPVVVRDLENGATFQKVRDSFQIAAPAKQQVFSESGRRYGGKRQTGETHDNAAIGWQALVRGATADAALANVEGLISDGEVALGGRFILFRPDGATGSVLFEIRATAEWQWKYAWAQFAGAQSSIVEVKIGVAPLARLLPMDVYDDFAADHLAEYTFDSGAISQVAVTGGQLTATSNLTTEKRLAHTVRGYSVLDAQDTVKGTPGATINGYKLGVELRRSASDTYINVYADDDGTNSRLRIDKVIGGGAPTNLASVNLAARITTGAPLWVRGRVEGNVVYAEHFTSTPTPMAAPVTSTSYALTGAEQAALPAGTGGITWVPQHAAATIDAFEHLPFTYRNVTLPEYLPLGGPIPGSADALADIAITHSGGAAAPIWALLAWTERPPAHNMMWGGDFEEDVNGWQTAAVTGVQAAAGSSITRSTTAARKYGSAAAQIVTPATAGAGINFPIYRRFRRGVTYTATLWAAASSATTAMVLKLGTNGDVATTTAVALTPSLVQWTVVWTPTADREVAYLSFQTNAATATTCSIDAVCVFEGTTPPAVGRHAEGAGAVPPFGIFEAEGADTGDISGWTITPSAGFRLGAGLYDPAASGATVYTAGWWIDPSLLVPDDFTLGEVEIEFFGRFNITSGNVGPRASLSARPEWGLGFGAERFTEFGSAGKNLVTMPVGGAQRLSRLGTITLPVDRTQPARWKLWMTASVAAGSSGGFGLDYLLAAPIRRRVAGATAKPNDGSYPDFIASTAETTRTVMSDLRGMVAKPPFAGQPVGGGLGGPQIELPSGDTDMVVKLSSLVPDDPTSNTTSEQTAHAATVHVAVTPRVHVTRDL